MAEPLITPQLNVNGTSATELLNNQLAVLDSLRSLLASMQRAHPHGRDFRTNAAFVVAMTAWQERITAISILKLEVEAHAEAIMDARDARQRPAKV